VALQSDLGNALVRTPFVQAGTGDERLRVTSKFEGNLVVSRKVVTGIGIRHSNPGGQVASSATSPTTT